MAGSLILVALSLLVFNHQSSLDTTALYFFGAYGLGIVAFWTIQLTAPQERLLWVALLMLVTLLTLWWDFLVRIAVALTVALTVMLIWLQQRPVGDGQKTTFKTVAFAPLARLAWLDKRSYSVFLIHFPVCLIFNAVLAGTLLYRCVEIQTGCKPAAPAGPVVVA